MPTNAPERVTLGPRGTLPPIDAERPAELAALSTTLPPEDVSSASGSVQPLTRAQAEVLEASAARWQAQVEALRRENDDLRANLSRERVRVRSLSEAIGVVNNLVTKIMSQGYE